MMIFKANIFFFHSKTKSCGVTIENYGKNYFRLLNKDNNKVGRFSIIEANVEMKISN